MPASNHTASTVSDALLKHVVPYFGTPRRPLSDRGREFVGEIWGKLMRSVGVQRLLTSPYHPEGNSINERSHRTINNMLRARLLDGASSRAWLEKIPGIMLALNAMTHEPHGFSASLIATGREPPTAYVEMLRQRLSLTHQQLTPSTNSCRLQPIPRGEPHLCAHHSPRAYQQADPTVEGTLCSKKGSQPIPGGVRGWPRLANGACESHQAGQTHNC